MNVAPLHPDQATASRGGGPATYAVPEVARLLGTGTAAVYRMLGPERFRLAASATDGSSPGADSMPGLIHRKEQFGIADRPRRNVWSKRG
jgi:hypothetical protein